MISYYRKVVTAGMFVFLTSGVAACSSARVNPLLSQEPDTTVSHSTVSELFRQSGLLWKLRYQRESLDRWIDIAERINLSTHRSIDLTQKLSQAYFLRAEFFLQTREEKMRDFFRGANWAEKGLTLNPEYKSRLIHQRLAPEYLLDSVRPAQLPLLYWFAVHLHSWAQLQGGKEGNKIKNRSKKIMDFLAQRAPGIATGGVYRYLGHHYSTGAALNPRDWEPSKRFFELALNRFPQSVANYSVYAQSYAQKRGETELFQKLLRSALQLKLRAEDEDYPEQWLEQVRVKKLLPEMRPESSNPNRKS